MSRTYGAAYQPLVARIERNRRDPSKTVAFIGPQLCFLERGAPVPAPGTDVEVMVTRAVYGTYHEGHDYAGRTDYLSLRALMVQPVDRTLHALVAIDGFECSGSMCRTTAHGRETDGRRPLTSEEMYPAKRNGESHSGWLTRTRGSMWLTPGRTDVFEAGNVNVRSDRSNEVPLRPMNVWVERSQIAEKSGCGVRVCGLSSLDDANWSALVRRARVQPRLAA